MCLDFLSERFEEGLGYSSINTARSAMVAVHHTLHGTPLLARFMKGIFNLRPALPRYNCTWDVATVLKYLQTLKLSCCDLKTLSQKLVMLLLLLSGQRVQTLQVLKLSNIKFLENKCIIYIDCLLKTSRPAAHTSHISFDSYSDPDLCIISHLREYIHLTKDFRNGCDQLLISFTKPHKPVSKDTVSRWAKKILHASGVDITSFTAHSTRSASTSKALAVGVPMDKIMQAASWTQAKTFGAYYNVHINVDQSSFGKDLLDNTVV